jgi:hypothetical protein
MVAVGKWMKIDENSPMAVALGAERRMKLPCTFWNARIQGPMGEIFGDAELPDERTEDSPGDESGSAH